MFGSGRRSTQHLRLRLQRETQREEEEVEEGFYSIPVFGKNKNKQEQSCHRGKLSKNVS